MLLGAATSIGYLLPLHSHITNRSSALYKLVRLTETSHVPTKGVRSQLGRGRRGGAHPDPERTLWSFLVPHDQLVRERPGIYLTRQCDAATPSH